MYTSYATCNTYDHLSLDVITDSTLKLDPWWQLQYLVEKVGIKFQIVQLPFATQETQIDILRLQVLGEPEVVKMTH